MTEEPSHEEHEETLSLVSLSLDGKRIMLNDKPQYALSLPLDLARKKYENTFEIVYTLIFDGCNSFDVFYRSDDNLNACTKEVVNQIYERARAAKKGSGSSSSSSSGGGGNRSDSEKLPEAAIMKYTVKRKNKIVNEEEKEESTEQQEVLLSQLWETVKIGGKYCLVSYDPLSYSLRWLNEIEEADRILVPYTENATEAYEFKDPVDLEYFIQRAKKETLGSLFRKVKRCASSFYDTDEEAYTNLIAADVVFTYFQDKIGKTHYVFVHGKPGTGKGAILETFNQLAYRGVQMTNTNAANLYRLLSHIEKGQVVIIIDEANRLDEDPFLLDVLKTGYKGIAKVPRMMDSSSAANSKQFYYYTYCFKIIAAENLPRDWKAGGFKDRCLIIKTAPGNPGKDITDVVDNADDPEKAKILSELQFLRKLLFAYRLIHFSEPIPDVRIKGIIGRDNELIKPLIRLFKTHGDHSSLETIKKTLHYFVKQRNQEHTDTFDAYVNEQLEQLISSREGQLTQEQLSTFGTSRQLSFNDIWENIIKNKLDGKEIPDKPDSLMTSLFGEQSKKHLAMVLRNLGGRKAKDSSGNKREWKFDLKTLERFTKSFNVIPDKIELEDQDTLESATHRAVISFINDDNEEEEAEEEKFSDRSDRSFKNNGGSETNLTSENRNENIPYNIEISGNGKGNNNNLDAKEIDQDRISVKDVSDQSETMPSRHISHIALEPYKDGPEGDRQRERDIESFKSMPMLRCPLCDFRSVHKESIDHHVKYKHHQEEEGGA